MTNILTSAQFKKLAVTAAKTADAKKAEDIRLTDISGHSTVTDYVLVASVDSTPQMEAVCDEIVTVLKEHGLPPVHNEGRTSPSWRVIDYGGLIVHVMMPETRDFYSIDKVFFYGTPVKWKSATLRKKAKSA